MIVTTFLFQHVEITTGKRSHIIVFVDSERFFFREVESNSRFIVMTIDEVTLDRPEIGTGFSVICVSVG